eukprot:scaffold16651_cov135-Isochrysis_galbana.AAC.2
MEYSCSRGRPRKVRMKASVGMGVDECADSSAVGGACCPSLRPFNACVQPQKSYMRPISGSLCRLAVQPYRQQRSASSGSPCNKRFGGGSRPRAMASLACVLQQKS